jgi:disulfide bond formation protein DsbB
MILEIVNNVLASLTVIAQLFIIAGWGYFLSRRKDPADKFLNFLGRQAVGLAFLVAVIATLASLFYSEIAGYPPCWLCWWQRLALFPQVILLGLALIKKENSVIDYSLTLLSGGILVALYHNYLSWGGSTLTACTASASGVSCLARYVFEFNYITIPLMSLSAFLLLILLLIVKRFYPPKIKS